MSNDRQGRDKHIVFECDCCDETIDTETADFLEAVDVKRAAGWGAEKVDGQWLDLCPRHNAK
jgi:hypothetical protein